MHLMCRLGRHRWRIEHDEKQQVYEICDRCRHYRTESSWVEASGQVDMPPPPFSSG
jgi:hypothetical protein